MKKKFKLLFLFFISSIVTFAQSKDFDMHGLYGDGFNAMSISIAGGGNYYFGDIEQEELTFESIKTQVNYSVQLGISYAFGEYVKLRANAVYGKLSGERHSYKFSSTIIEPGLLVEYHPFKVHSNKYDFYFFTGGAFVLSQLEAVDLTYNNDRKISINAPVIPLGMGYNYNFSNGLQLGFELSARFSIFDNEDFSLDGYPYSSNGVMIRGQESKFIDGYCFLGVKFGYQWSF